MPIFRLNHAVLYVRDLERSVAFYRDVLGFKTVMTMGGAAAFIQAMRSGKPASPRFLQQTSWNALPRLLVPIPSICTTTNPSSAIACGP